MAERGKLGFRPAHPGGETGTDETTKPPIEGAEVLDDDIAAALVPVRDKRGHKGSFGKLLVIAGSLDYAGAALLVCRAAGRAGAGLVTLAVPESLQPLFAAKVVEATTMALPEDDVEEIDPEPALARVLDHDHDAIVLGPGLRPGLATVELVRLILASGEEGSTEPVVLDAEALRSLAAEEAWWGADRRPSVLTPHAGEFARLRVGSGREPGSDGDLGEDDVARAIAARDAAATWGQVVVLKGARTVIAAPDGSVAVAPFENPALATGGTGDVLSGTIGALLAQHLAPYDAARLGVYLHGLAGDSVRDRLGDAGLLASDLPEPIAMARKRLAAIAERKEKAGRLGFGVRAPGPVPVPAVTEPPAEADPPDADPAEPAPAAPAPVGPTETGESRGTGDSVGTGTGS
jgi:NAD(P)H-hydrate epimerase